MEPQLEKIREIQKESWNKSSHGWKKWDELTMNFFKPTGDEIINMLRLNTDDTVLDIATGTGEPGLTIASLLKKGKTIGTDIAEEMLVVARENAAKRGIKNFETVCCDVTEMPFEKGSFDAISCRFGFMFFPDMSLAIKEMLRVLKPGGRIAASVWDLPEKNFWISASMETMISRLQLSPPAPGAPGLFRCAQKSYMIDLLTQSGLKNIDHKEITGKLRFANIEMYWQFITEVACPLAFTKAEDTIKDQIKEEVLGKVNKRFPDGNIALGSSAIVVYGEK